MPSFLNYFMKMTEKLSSFCFVIAGRGGEDAALQSVSCACRHVRATLWLSSWTASHCATCGDGETQSTSFLGLSPTKVRLRPPWSRLVELSSRVPFASPPISALLSEPLLNMAFNALTDLKPGPKHWIVCVRISRLWEYRGGTDNGEVQHVDMVLVDNQLVIAEGQHHPVPAIFVGMLMRSFLGEDFLSGNSACRWYINPNDPRASDLLISFADLFEPLALIEVTTEPAKPRVATNQIEHKTLAQLDALSPYQFPPEGFKCTAVIKNLQPGETWWFAACNRCGKKSLPHGDGYRCTSCACTGKKFRFKVCTVCTDGTAEGEFMLFGDIGEQVVGNQVGAILRTEKQGVDLPPDIAAVVAKKFTWNVSLTEESFYRKKENFPG